MQVAVFALVSAAFTCIYITQPILPVLQEEFGVSPVSASFTVSAVVLGIAISCLPFGALADRFSIKPIILVGGLCVSAGGMVSAASHDYVLLIAARLFQGFFIPALTICLAAWLAKVLPGERLSVVMGSYVAATVLGALAGRLVGGWLYSPLHWRWAMISASCLVLAAAVLAALVLPGKAKEAPNRRVEKGGFWPILKRKEILLVCAAGASGLFMFSPVFTFLPYRLSGEPFNLSLQMVTMVYFLYVTGIFLGPLAGRISNRLGAGNTLIAGACIMGASFALLLLPYLAATLAALLGVCIGFFIIHAVAVGLLNRKLVSGHGKANAIYMLIYYASGWLGITGAGFAFEQAGWSGMVGFVACFLLIPMFTGWREARGAHFESGEV